MENTNVQEVKMPSTYDDLKRVWIGSAAVPMILL